MLTRTVRDTAALIDVISGSGGPWPAPPLPGRLVDEVGRPVRQLRIGVWTASFNQVDVEADCRDAALDCAGALEAMGHLVSVAAPAPLSDPALWQAMGQALCAQAAADLAVWERRLARPIGQDDVEPVTWRVVQPGRAMTAVQLLEALATMQSLCVAAEPWWDDHDVLVTPASAEPAQPVGAYLAAYQPGRGSAFTRPFNATGQPAIVIPWSIGADGLPRGVQLVAPLGREDLLIRLAALLEQTHPPPKWGQTRLTPA